MITLRYIRRKDRFLKNKTMTHFENALRYATICSLAPILYGECAHITRLDAYEKDNLRPS
jgi:hypothetical protein